MGVVWEAYHKGVPLLGVHENPIELLTFDPNLLGHLSSGTRHQNDGCYIDMFSDVT